MKTGIDRIKQERQEQIEKHGYSREKDQQRNLHGQLVMAAVFCLTLHPGYWPATWDLEYRDKIASKDPIERYTIAGALIAAELDRLAGVKEDTE